MNPRKKKRTMKSKLTLDLKSASIVRLKRMKHTPTGTGTMDQFGIVRTISKTTNGSGQSGDFVKMTNSEIRTGQSRNTGLSNAPADPEVDSEKTSRQRMKARISTSTKLPRIDRVTPPLVSH